MKLIEILEKNFDPTDANKSMELAYGCLKLMRHATLAIETDNLGLHMGRDQKADMHMAIIDVARLLNLLDYHPLSADIGLFLEGLKNYR